MENTKKRQNTSNETKHKKKLKIETAADAVRALDDIVLDPFPLRVQLEEIPVTGNSKIPSSFFDNHLKMKYTAVGQVYMTSTSDEDVRVPLEGDIDSLIRSHERWELVARKLKEKCLELKRQNQVLIPTNLLRPVPPTFQSS